ncbi:hypothetical protein J6590_060991 [Homalodisca vitripennis]|nr:hypothetical protein J6590_060991 [Homalodisca vitripennis]
MRRLHSAVILLFMSWTPVGCVLQTTDFKWSHKKSLRVLSVEILPATQLILYYRSSDPGSVHLAIVSHRRNIMWRSSVLLKIKNM